MPLLPRPSDLQRRAMHPVQSMRRHLPRALPAFHARPIEIADQVPVDPIVGADGVASVFLYDEAKCIRCGLCAIRCPTSAITMERFQFEEVEAR